MKAKTFIFIFSLFLFISCSQESAVIKEVNSKVIYEYKNKDSFPKQRLSLFIASNTDVRKFDSITIKDSNSDFCWETEDLFRFTNSDLNYAGYASFVLPDGDVFSDGMYNITITTKANENLEYDYNLNYKKELLSLKAEAAVDEMKKSGAIENICIYDSENKLLFFGTKSDDFKTNRDIWLKYNNAESYNIIWILDNRSTMCILPSEKVTPGD